MAWLIRTIDDSGTSILVDVLDQLHGGTGYSFYSEGDILYAGPRGGLRQLSASDDGYVLALVRGFPEWASLSDPSLRSPDTVAHITVGKNGVLGADDGYLMPNFEIATGCSDLYCFLPCVDGWLRDLHVYCEVPPTNPATITVRVNDVDTLLSVVLVGNTVDNTVDVVPVFAGLQRVSVKIEGADGAEDLIVGFRQMLDENIPHIPH